MRAVLLKIVETLRAATDPRAPDCIGLARFCTRMHARAYKSLRMPTLHPRGGGACCRMLMAMFTRVSTDVYRC
jgi:hypothetical protein